MDIILLLPRVSPESVTRELTTEPTMEPKLTTERVARSAAKMRRKEPFPPAGPWKASSTKKSGIGAFQSFVQETFGEWLGIVSIVKVFDRPILTEEECTLITISLEHRELLRDYPITRSKVVRIANEHLQLLENLSSTSEQQQIPGSADGEP